MKLRYSEFGERIDVDAFEEAIGFTPTTQRNDEDTGQCPDVWGLHKHGDTTGKFSINRDKRVYNCWVCGGGSLLDLTMASQDLPEREALEWLYQFAHPEEVSAKGLDAELDKIFASNTVAVQPLPYFNVNTLAQYDTEYDHPWFAERGINEGTIVRHRLKVDNKSHRGQSIIIPHFWEGRLVGWQKRYLDGEKPKYTNTRDFPREETVFNRDLKSHSFRFDWLTPLVVESPVTVLFLESLGYPAIATFGSNVTNRQLETLRVFQGGVILARDYDRPGEKWLKDLTEYLQDYIPVYHCPVVETEEGADLGDLVGHEDLVHELIRDTQLAVETEL